MPPSDQAPTERGCSVGNDSFRNSLSAPLYLPRVSQLLSLRSRNPPSAVTLLEVSFTLAKSKNHQTDTPALDIKVCLGSRGRKSPAENSKHEWLLIALDHLDEGDRVVSP